jgi:hypothetical protein
MDTQQQALFIFRKLVYVLYQEIGALQTRNHPQLAQKAFLKTAFFQGERERQAASLYHQIENEENLETIVGMFQQRTGLTLEDIHRAFVEGDWRNKFGSYNFGGPKWVRISEVALELRKMIQEQNWEEVMVLIQEIKGLKTNQGYLISMFDWSERRRNG